MLRPAVMLAALAIAPARQVDADAPRGRVVRIERTRVVPLVTPVLCVQMLMDGTGLCIGPQPKAGEVIVVVDETQVLAEIRVDTTTKAMANCDAVWNIGGTVVRGDPTQGRRSRSIGLIDGGVDRQNSRRVPDSKVTRPAPDSRVEIGIDRDGDGHADVIAAEAACPNVGGECIEFWTRRAKGMERVWSTNLRACR
jgi:hypothetical protein